MGKWRAVAKSATVQRFRPLPPTARQIEKWHPVGAFSGKSADFGVWAELWRAVVISREKPTKIMNCSKSQRNHTSQLAQAARHTAGNGRATSLATFDPSTPRSGQPIAQHALHCACEFYTQPLNHMGRFSRDLPKWLALGKKVERC